MLNALTYHAVLMCQETDTSEELLKRQTNLIELKRSFWRCALARQEAVNGARGWTFPLLTVHI